ncbi:MAG: hypothetical protein ACKVS8_07565 [Phycisphaerales bacterium]
MKRSLRAPVAARIASPFVAAALALLAGCAGGGTATTNAPSESKTTLATPPPAGPIDTAAQRTEAMYKQMGKDAGATRVDRSGRTPESGPRVLEAPPASPTTAAALPLAAQAGSASGAGAGEAHLTANSEAEVPQVSPPAAGPAIATAPLESVSVRVIDDPHADRRELTRQLAETLAPSAMNPGEPMRLAATAAALGPIDPSASDATLSAWQARLSPEQQPTFAIVRDLYSKLPAAASDPAALASLLREQADGLQPGNGITIGAAALCRRVEGFGRYIALDSTTIVAGRAQPVIVYVEPQHFGHRTVDAPDGEQRWAVELAQELQLYHDADGMLAWMDREQTISETSRRQRRDFYLVRRIDLPATLSIGAYRLKVVVRDRVSGSVAESIIPIQVVADANLTSRPVR